MNYNTDIKKEVEVIIVVSWYSELQDTYTSNKYTILYEIRKFESNKKSIPCVSTIVR